MSEMQDAAQIIRVAFEGAEIAIKVGGAGWDFVKGIFAVFKNLFEQEKLAGKTSVKQLLKSGGDLQVFKLRTEDMEKVKKMADKYGILYSILPDLNKSDGMSEILFHSQAAPRIQSIMEQVQNSQIESMDDYFSNAEPEELEKAVKEAAKKPDMPGEREYRVVAEEFIKNPGVKVSDIRSRLNMTWVGIWPIVKHMEQSGLAEFNKDGTVAMKKSPEEFQEFVDSAQWKAWFGKEEAKRRPGQEISSDKAEEIHQFQKGAKDNPNVNAITIDRKMVVEETEKHIKTRIPYKKNEYIWLKKSEITWINDNKTIYAGLEKEKHYQVLDMDNKPVRNITGQKLYEQSYDEVIRNRQRQEQGKIRKKKKQADYVRNQKSLTDARRALNGKRGR